MACFLEGTQLHFTTVTTLLTDSFTSVKMQSLHSLCAILGSSKYFPSYLHTLLYVCK